MSVVSGLPGCCGIQELRDIHDDENPEQSIMEIEPHEQAFIVFSTIKEFEGGFKVGERLAAAIKKHKLGSVVVTRSAINPNSDNHIKAYMWKINPMALERYQAKYRKANSLMDDGYNDDPYYNSFW